VALKPETRQLIICISAGLLARALFYFFGAELYFGKEDFFIGGDTQSFLYPVQNLLEHGTYTVNPAHPHGAFGREPGYAFFLIPFYLLFKSDLDLMYKAVAWIQILMDSLAVLLVYRIAMRLFKDKRTAFWSSMLYALYPFAVVWTPVVHAETLGLDITLLIIYFISSPPGRYKWILTGSLIAAGFFVRPQLIFILPSVLLALFITRQMYKNWLVNSLQLCLGFLIIYLPWPARNYIFHDRLEWFRDISSMRNWQDDVMNFEKYMVSFKVDSEPQFTQLITGRQVVFPKEAFLSKEDSLKIIRAVHLSRTCSDGFAAFLQKARPENECTAETAELWEELYENQKKNNKLNYYLLVPLGNLKKALFKNALIENWKAPKHSSINTYLIGGLFLYRSALILMGLAGAFLLLRRYGSHMRESLTFYTSLLFFLSWYIYMCWIFRSLEMRYFVPADALLLIPASFFLSTFVFPGIFAKSPKNNQH
jgi:hypothetical protein